MGAEFLEHNGYIPRRLKACSRWVRGLRLAICRGSEKKDNQPHCFNLSRGENQRFRKTVALRICALPQVRNYCVTAARRRWRGWSREALRWARPYRYQFRCVLPVFLPLSPCAPPLEPTGPVVPPPAPVIAGPFVDRLPDGIFETFEQLADHETAIVGQRDQGRVGQNLNGVARVQANDARSHAADAAHPRSLHPGSRRSCRPDLVRPHRRSCRARKSARSAW